MENNRNKQIIEAVSNKDQAKLNELNVSKDEIESILKTIDKRIENYDSEILEYIINVEKNINYTFPEEYKNYILKNSAIKPDKNIFGLLNGEEKTVKYFYSIDQIVKHIS